ncbi:hypothetical protein [Massilia sp. 9096]|uniref:hypothetical protein n=1 Tax=Massilia sp. 9096 TaxID=1500894 RepID=UPI000A5F5983|nr:hypothetical protein [Massilia sp. 9096]
MLKLLGMTRAFAAQPMLDLARLGFEEWLDLAVGHKATKLGGKTLVLRLERAKLKPNMAAEDTDYATRVDLRGYCSNDC